MCTNSYNYKIFNIMYDIGAKIDTLINEEKKVMNIKITTLSSTDAYCRPSSGINALNALFYSIQYLLLF